jgi:hypothetical protein
MAKRVVIESLTLTNATGRTARLSVIENSHRDTSAKTYSLGNSRDGGKSMPSLAAATKAMHATAALWKQDGWN